MSYKLRHCTFLFFIIFIFNWSFLQAQVYIDYVHIWWTENGQSQEMLYVQENTSYTINRDSGTPVNVRIFKTSSAPSQVQFFTYDGTNDILRQIVSSAGYETLNDVAGENNTIVYASVETYEGAVTITVNNISPPPSVTSITISVQPGNVVSGNSPTGNGTIFGSGAGSLEYHWITRKPGGIYVDSGPLYSTMTNGSASIPNYTNFPTDLEGQYSVRVLSDNIESPKAYYTVTPALNISVTEPSNNISVNQGDQVAIQWAASGQSGSTVSLYYDDDTDWGNGTIAEIDNSLSLIGSYSWYTSGIIPGTYYVVGMVTDGSGSEYDYAPGTVTINPGYIIELELHKITDTNGTPNSDNPGNERASFIPESTVRVTLKATNTGTSVSVQTVLNIRGPDNVTWVYDSNPLGQNNSTDSPLENGETDYYSFDWVLPSNAQAGDYDIGGSIRNLNNFDEVYDVTLPGPNNGFDPGWILEDRFSVVGIYPTRFKGNLFVDNSTKPGSPILLEAKLEEDNFPFYTDIENVPIYFQIYINNNWQTISEDGITTTSLITDASSDPGLGSGGIGRVYYLPPDDMPLGLYPIKAVYDGNSQYAPTEINAALEILPSHTESPLLIKPDDPTYGDGIPLILVHGNRNDKEENRNTYWEWENFYNYIQDPTNVNEYKEFDVYVWRHDTELPIGFNGSTGNAKELTYYIYNEILPSYPANTKVLFVAHSRGGLVSRSFMNYNNQGDDVLGLITLGTPHHGSPFAVPDWSAIVWGMKIGTNAQWAFTYNQLVKTDISLSLDPAFDYDRMGSLNLAWDNLDAAIGGTISMPFETSFSTNGSVYLTTRDQNLENNYADLTIIYADQYKSEFGTLELLNQNENYFSKIITYSAYDDDLSDNGDLDLIGAIMTVVGGPGNWLNDHTKLEAITHLLAYFSENITSNNSVYYANDGLVPLQSALFLDISNGTPFSTMDASEQISLLNSNIVAKKQVKDQRIFSNSDGIFDHKHFLDAPLNNNYWATLTSDIRSFLTDGNDDPTVATQITVPHTGDYEINPDGDLDWYRVTLNSGIAYKFVNSSLEGFDSKFWLYGPGDAGGINAGPLVAEDDNSGGNLQPSFQYTPTISGYYYLRVAYYDNNPVSAIPSKGEENTKNSQQLNPVILTGAYTLDVSITQPSPTISNISPTSKMVGSAGFTLTVNGSNFISTSVVKFNGNNRVTTNVNSTQLTASILTSDLTTEGTYPITVFNPAPGGGTSNAQTFTVEDNPIITTFPYDQNFDNFPSGIVTGLIAEGWTNLITGDDGDWTVHNGATTSFNTGPSGDHTSGTGKYLYTESSAGSNPGNPNKSAYLLSPQFDISTLTNPMLSFWYHMYGATMGELHVDVYDGSVWADDLFLSSGDQGDLWRNGTVDLSSFSGIITIRFRGITGSSYTSDMAIDDINIDEIYIAVNAPQTGANWQTGTQKTVAWTSHNITGNVNILLSTDGGNTFPITLAADTPNDDTEPITVPNNPSTTCRVKVESVNNTSIFGLNPGNFIIEDNPVVYGYWSQQVSNTSDGLTSVFFLNDQLGWAVGAKYGNHATILKTTNGGVDWNIMSEPILNGSSYIGTTFFIDPNTGWIAGYDNNLLKTIDGGVTWVQQLTQPYGDLFSLYFVSANIGWVAGLSGIILKTTDGGQSWLQQNTNTSNTFYSIYLYDNNLGWAAGSVTILKTTNGGTTWVTQNSSSVLFRSIKFIDQNNGWASATTGTQGLVYKTTDGGTNWSSQSLSSSKWLYSIDFTDVNNGWTVGFDSNEKGLIFNTTDGGISWSLQAGNLPSSLQSVFFTNQYNGWAVGNGGLILKYRVPQISANLKVFLQGCYSSGVMTTSLNTQGLIPSNQPYNVVPWNYSGTETVGSIPTDVVDWVLVELRSDLTTLVSRRAGFLKSDGSIVDLDGTSTLGFAGVIPGDYYIVLHHRNHLSIMSAATHPINISSTLYDFTTSLNQAYTTGAAPMIDLGDGYFGMISGNANGDGYVTSGDKNIYWVPQNGLSGYLSGDFNLNGYVTSGDKNLLWMSNNGKSTQVP